MLILWGLSRILFFSWLPHGKHWYIIPMGSIDTLYIYHFWNPSNLKTEHNIYNIFNWLPNEESGGWRLWFSVNYKILNESYTFLYRKSDAPWAPENRWEKNMFWIISMSWGLRKNFSETSVFGVLKHIHNKKYTYFVNLQTWPLKKSLGKWLMEKDGYICGCRWTSNLFIRSFEKIVCDI